MALAISGQESIRASIPAIAELSRVPDPGVRLRAVEMLSVLPLNETAPLPALEAAQTDPDPGFKPPPASCAVTESSQQSSPAGVRTMNIFTTDHPMASRSPCSDPQQHPFLSLVCSVFVVSTPFVIWCLYAYLTSVIGAEGPPEDPWRPRMVGHLRIRGQPPLRCPARAVLSPLSKVVEEVARSTNPAHHPALPRGGGPGSPPRQPAPRFPAGPSLLRITRSRAGEMGERGPKLVVGTVG
jgi:hypothetical protein